MDTVGPMKLTSPNVERYVVSFVICLYDVQGIQSVYDLASRSDVVGDRQEYHVVSRFVFSQNAMRVRQGL